jgi:hypothetical protein
MTWRSGGEAAQLLDASTASKRTEQKPNNKEAKMKFFHAIPDRTDFLEHRPGMNLLVSAYRLNQHPRILKHLYLAGDTFLDSGMVSALNGAETDWAEKTEFYLGMAKALRPRRVAMLDIPCQPRFLEKVGWSMKKAMSVTYRNAELFMAANSGGTKVLVVQGRELRQYRACIEHYHKKGYLAQPCWIGIGSIRGRKPEEMYEICRLVREMIPKKHIHAFGVGAPSLLADLQKIGINSADSSTASIRVAYNCGITGPACGGGEKRTDRTVKRLFADEMHEVERSIRAAGVILD